MLLLLALLLMLLLAPAVPARPPRRAAAGCGILAVFSPGLPVMTALGKLLSMSAR
jgi:hypothetical protein